MIKAPRIYALKKVAYTCLPTTDYLSKTLCYFTLNR